MDRTQIFRFLAFACLACLYPFASICVFATPAGGSDTLPTAQIQYASINVNGRTLTGPNSSAQRRDGQILIPVMALARSLGDVVNIDATARTVNVRRQAGTLSEFDARIGQIRENGASILTISNAGAIIFLPNIDDFLLPTEITAALFDVAIRYDGEKNTVMVTRGQANSVISQSKNDRGFAELYQVEYEYSLNRYSSNASHDLIVSGAGRIADGRFYFSSSASNSSQHGISMRNGTFSFERPNGQRYVAGDFGTGSDLQFLSSNVRGGMARIPVGGTVVTAFAGRTYSGAVQPEADPLQSSIPLTVNPPKGFRYDTGVFGFLVTTNTSIAGNRIKPWTFSAGAMRFSGSNRSGELVSGSASYNTSRFRFQSDVAYGKFSDRKADNGRTNGYAAAIDLTGTFQITSSLVFQARYAHIGMKFLSPQAGLREPLDLKAAGITWTPKKWFSTSINASVVSRPGDPTKRDEFVTSAFSITPGGTAPRFFFSHTQSNTSQMRSSAFTYLNASKEFSRWRLFLNATRRKTVGPAEYNSQFGTNFRINDGNQIEVSQGIGSKGSYNGQFDWRTSGLFDHKLSFSAGGGYTYTKASRVSGYERFTASLNLPRNTSLQVSYMQTNAGSTLMVSLRGTLFQKREATAFLNASASEINSFAKVEGRVYQDINLNGHFDPGVDKPQPDVKVRVDGSRYVVSDINGTYRFESVTAGDHKVYLDLLSVRADLTLLGDDVQKATLAAASNSTIDFRLVRTGRLRGRVWMDTNGNGKFDEGEKPLADVRVFTGSGRDTLTDADGYFVISDLAPGEHVIIVDEKTLPEKTMPGFKPLAVQVYSGRETGEVDLAVILVPADFKWFSKRKNN